MKLKEEIERLMDRIQPITKEEAEKRREIQRKNKYQMHLGESSLYPEERKYKLKNYEVDSGNRDAVEIAEKFEKTMSINTLIIGGVMGSGKTHLAIAIAKKIAYFEEKTIEIVRAANISEKDSKNGAGILIIDDIGRERGSDYDVAKKRGLLCDLIEHRYLLGRRQIYTTNSSTANLANLFGSHIFDRIKTNAVFANIKGCSRRDTYKGG